MEAHRSFHAIYPLKRPSMEARRLLPLTVETPMYFHGSFHWLPLKYIYFQLPLKFPWEYYFTDFPGSVHESNLTSVEVSFVVVRNSHGRISNGSPWIHTEILWKQLEVCDTRGSRYIEIGRDVWKLKQAFAECVRVTDGSNASFHFHRQWKIPCISMEASTK